MRFDEVLRKYGYPFIGKEVAECISQGRKALQTGKYSYRLAKLQGKALDKDGNKSLFNKEKVRTIALRGLHNIALLLQYYEEKARTRLLKRER